MRLTGATCRPSPYSLTSTFVPGVSRSLSRRAFGKTIRPTSSTVTSTGSSTVPAESQWTGRGHDVFDPQLPAAVADQAGVVPYTHTAVPSGASPSSQMAFMAAIVTRTQPCEAGTGGTLP